VCQRPGITVSGNCNLFVEGFEGQNVKSVTPEPGVIAVLTKKAVVQRIADAGEIVIADVGQCFYVSR
jgi:hypothetical protein